MTAISALVVGSPAIPFLVSAGVGFQTKERYLFGGFDLEIKLVPGESAGTITSLYVSAPLSSICGLVNYSTALLRLARIMVQCRSKLPHLVSS